MKLLLDTHIWLWSVLDPRRLSRKVSLALADPQNELWLSPISVWELATLHAKGRFRLPDELPAWVAKTVDGLQLTEAPLTVEVALAVQTLRFNHRDPADQFLAAAAKVFDLTLVTADKKLAEVDGIRVLHNR
jgi:PIN domain nuclease of toxin-antitoxin system